MSSNFFVACQKYFNIHCRGWQHASSEFWSLKHSRSRIIFMKYLAHLMHDANYSTQSDYTLFSTGLIIKKVWIPVLSLSKCNGILGEKPLFKGDIQCQSYIMVEFLNTCRSQQTQFKLSPNCPHDRNYNRWLYTASHWRPWKHQICLKTEMCAN